MFKGRKAVNGSIYIENPIQALLHFMLCQNWSEIQGLNKVWGKEESPLESVLINTSNNLGSYNHANLNELKTLKISRQLTDESECWTDSLIQSICEDFFILNYQDAGYESFIDIFASQTPIDTITLNDCKKIGILKEVEEVYSEPILKYGYDQMSVEFKKEIRITNTWKTTYDSSYVTGITNPSSAEAYWNYFHNLYLKFKKIDEVPNNIQEKKWFTEESTALWYLYRLYRMSKMYKIDIDINYSKGRLYKLGQQLTLLLPHQTNNNPVNCIIESFTKNKNENTVELGLLILDEIDIGSLQQLLIINNSSIGTYITLNEQTETEGVILYQGES